MSGDLRVIRNAFAETEYNLSKHAFIEMLKDDISVEVFEQTLHSDAPEIIEDYPNDSRGPCCVVLAWIENNGSFHACIGYAGTKPVLITIYRPDPRRWSSDFRRRR